jgi:hypothetical protein
METGNRKKKISADCPAKRTARRDDTAELIDPGLLTDVIGIIVLAFFSVRQYRAWKAARKRSDE